MWDASPVLIKMPKVCFVDDGPGKPEGINHFIGRRPIFAFGNSDGDKEMLEWTACRRRLCASWASSIIPTRSANMPTALRACLPDSKVGTFSQALMDEATGKGWTIANMKNDWKTIFPPAKTRPEAETRLVIVIPAQAGDPVARHAPKRLDPGFRRGERHFEALTSSCSCRTARRTKCRSRCRR